MKQECRIVKARGKDLEPGDVIRWSNMAGSRWREIMDIFRAEEDLDAHYGAELWRTDPGSYYKMVRARARALDNMTESYLLARVIVQEQSQDGIEDELIMLYEYDLYDVQSLSARE